MRYSIMTGAQFEDYQRKTPVIYAWTRNGMYLYIGMSTRGMIRFLNREHHVIGRALPMLGTDVIRVWTIRDASKLRMLESRMIRRFRPLLNGNRGNYEAFLLRPGRETEREKRKRLIRVAAAETIIEMRAIAPRAFIDQYSTRTRLA